MSGELEQSDGTGWMAFYALAMLRMAVELARTNPTYDVMVTKFLEHFVDISRAMNGQGLWDEQDGFFYDRLVVPDGDPVVMRYRSIVGVMPVLAGVQLAARAAMDLGTLQKRFAAFFERQRGRRIGAEEVGRIRTTSRRGGAVPVRREPRAAPPPAGRRPGRGVASCHRTASARCPDATSSTRSRSRCRA